MYGNKMELRENQKADVVLEHIVQDIVLFWHSPSPVSISTVRTEGHQEVGKNWQLA